VFELTKEYSGLGIEWNISGSATIVDIAPIVRGLIPVGESKNINLFVQGGAGLFIVNLKAKVGGRYLWYYLEIPVEESENKFGLLIGGGLIISKGRIVNFEVFPLYHITFGEDKNSYYFTINLGIGFKKKCHT